MDMQGAMEIDTDFQEVVQSYNAVIVDLSGVEFLASMGLRSLIMAAKSMHSRSGRMVLMRPTELVEQVLRASGTDGLIAVVRDQAAAEILVMA
jgi:anti-anti-sigma factor